MKYSIPFQTSVSICILIIWWFIDCAWGKKVTPSDALALNEFLNVIIHGIQGSDASVMCKVPIYGFPRNEENILSSVCFLITMDTYG